MPTKPHTVPQKIIERVKMKFSTWQVKAPSALLEMLYPVLFTAALPLSHFVSPTNLNLYMGEMTYVLIMYIFIAVVVFGFVALLLKTATERLVAALILIYVFMENYEARVSHFIPIVKVFIPIETPFDVLPSAIFAIFSILFVSWIVGLGVRWLRKRVSQEQLYLALRILVVFVFTYNLIIFATYINERKNFSSFEPNIAKEAEVTKKPDRDIYYIVFDRYTSDTAMRNYYNFDNTVFSSELKKNGFYVRDDAYSNYQFTAPSLASTLSMNYLSQISEKLKNEKHESFIPYRKVINDPLLYKYLHDAGYTTHHIGSSWNVTRKQDAAGTSNPNFEMNALGRKFILNEFESLLIEKSVFARFFKAGVNVGGFPVVHMAAGVDSRSIVLSQLETLKAFAKRNNPSQPRFMFAHFITPHPDYVFTSDGNVPAYSVGDDSIGLSRADKYTNQVQFINKKIIQLVEDIKTSSKTEPIIILQADEGQYPLAYLENKQLEWQKTEQDVLKEKFGILAAYNLPGVPVGRQEEEQINSVNIFRFVLNRYMGTDLEYLPDCSFVYNKNEPFRFYDITNALHPHDDSCAGIP